MTGGIIRNSNADCGDHTRPGTKALLDRPPGPDVGLEDMHSYTSVPGQFTDETAVSELFLTVRTDAVEVNHPEYTGGEMC